MVTIEVGPEKEHFVVHQSFLCAKSPYFDKALSGSFQEAITRSVRLPEVSPVLFRIFVAWLYYGNLSYLPPIGKTARKDFDSLEITEEIVEQSLIPQRQVQDSVSNEVCDSDDSDDEGTETLPDPVVNIESVDSTASTPGTVGSPASASTDEVDCLEDDPTTWPFDVLVQLYLLADYLQSRELRAVSLDTLNKATVKQNSIIPLIVVRYTYKNTSAGSLLRKYLVHHTAYRHPFDEDVSSYVNLPVEFLAAVMVNSSRRLPYTQCGECYGKALKATSVLGPEVDERDPATDIPPYKTDMCLYHEHTNDEERKACHLRREGAKSAA
jgi:hypothetical protein